MDQEQRRPILVTGGAGFIGSNLVRMLVREAKEHVINLDKLTYAGNRYSVADLESYENYIFIQGDICNRELVSSIFKKHCPIGVMHLAAESHVDRSIEDPKQFVETNVVGTATLLEEARLYWKTLSEEKQKQFRFLAVSTDEVFGALGPSGCFCEDTPYDPSSPYSATKAAADHLVRAYFRTYKLPTIITNCTNNYGPYQYPEKLIPLMITRALTGEPLPVYGRGENVRDWIYVEDHCQALYRVFQAGALGRTYLIGGEQEQKNIDVVNTICEALERFFPAAENPQMHGKRYQDLITFVTDRPGHDFRYAVDASRITRELDWKPKESFSSGMEKTIAWYIENQSWVKRVKSSDYQQWVSCNYEMRLGEKRTRAAEQSLRVA